MTIGQRLSLDSGVLDRTVSRVGGVTPRPPVPASNPPPGFTRGAAAPPPLAVACWCVALWTNITVTVHSSDTGSWFLPLADRDPHWMSLSAVTI